MAKFIDLTNKQFGKLVVLSRAENHILPSGKPRTMWNCKCECGNNAIVSSQNLIQAKTTSCGCVGKKNRLNGREKKNDLSGQRFGRLIVLEKDKSIITSAGTTRTKWKCLCDCGNKTSVYRNGLINGKTKSCGCLKKEITHNRLFKDITNQRYGKLIAIKCAEIRKTKKGAASTIWLCKCDCGNYVNVSVGHLTDKHVTSCGCDKTSRGESAIKEFLLNQGIKFKKEMIFDDLKSESGKSLRFDFALFDNDELKCLIEFQGPQHYKEIKWNNFGKLQREKTDLMKKVYCKNKHIPLYEIKYNDNILPKCIEILQELKLHVNPVLSSEESEKV